MKPNTRSTSTTATPPSSKFALGGRVAVGLASSAAVTVPVAGWLLHKHGPVVVLAVGLLPLLPYLLIVVSFVVLYFTVSIAAIVATFRAKPALADGRINGINWLYIQITNAPVAMLTLKPLKPVIREQAPEAAAQLPPEPLPPADPHVAENEDTPNYWKAFQHLAAQPGGAPDIVPAEDEITEPIQTVRAAGRHTRRQSNPDADLART